MKKTILYIIVIAGIGLTACTHQNPSTSQPAETSNTLNQKSNNMKNLISIVEIPITDFARATTFYKTILGVAIEEMEMDGAQMGVLPGGGETVNVVLVKGNDYKPTMEGAVIYLYAGDDLQPMLEKVKASGGTVIVPKTEISAEMGFFALFIDTEGNKIGLHSAR